MKVKATRMTAAVRKKASRSRADFSTVCEKRLWRWPKRVGMNLSVRRINSQRRIPFKIRFRRSFLSALRMMLFSVTLSSQLMIAPFTMIL